MNNRILSRLALACSVFACPACGNSNGLVPVLGKVVYKGEPAQGAVVTFHREGADDAVIPSGIADAQGEFSLDSTPMGRGALPGRYSVAVRWPDGSQPGEPPSKARTPTKGVARATEPVNAERRKFGYIQPDRLKGRYSRPEKSPLKAEIQPQSNRLPPFELVD